MLTPLFFISRWYVPGLTGSVTILKRQAQLRVHRSGRPQGSAIAKKIIELVAMFSPYLQVLEIAP
jgi:hypothetical protein